MHFTQPQVSKILEDILQIEDGLNTILKLSLLTPEGICRLSCLIETLPFPRLLTDRVEVPYLCGE
jgi:hypothetical protein